MFLLSLLFVAFYYAGIFRHTNSKDDLVKASNKKGILVFATAGPGTRTAHVRPALFTA
jgi:hypothetical protein